MTEASDRAEKSIEPPSGALAKIASHLPVQLHVRVGTASMKLSELLELSPGAIVELDKRLGDPVEIFAGDVLVARGELVRTDDRLAVRITEIAQPGD